MKYVKDKKGYYRKQNLKEFFIDLKKHQKWLLAITFVIILIQVPTLVYVLSLPLSLFSWTMSFLMSPKSTFHELLSIDFLMLRLFLPIVALILNLVFLHKRKFSYIICSINIIVTFLNPFVQLLPLAFVNY